MLPDISDLVFKAQSKNIHCTMHLYSTTIDISVYNIMGDVLLDYELADGDDDLFKECIFKLKELIK